MFHPAQIANEHETQKLPSFYSTSRPLPPLSALPSLSPPSFLPPLPSLLLLLAVLSAASASVLAVDVAAGGRQRYVYVTFASY